METNGTRMCELLVGLPDIDVLSVDDQPYCPIRVMFETRTTRPWCSECGARAEIKDRPSVELVDLPCFGRAARLVWRKRRWRRPEAFCDQGSWTEAERIAEFIIDTTDPSNEPHRGSAHS